MKFVAMFAGLAALGVSAGAAENKHVRIDLDALPPPSSSTPKAAPADTPTAPVPTTKKAPDDKKKKEKETPKIDGMPISRAGGGYLGVKVENNVFKISFYNAEKKPVAPDVASAVLRWPVTYKKAHERAQLTPGSDGKSLTSEKSVRAPFDFKLFITLLKTADTGEEKATETYVIDFNQTAETSGY
jgi:hypothetical protein